MSAFDRKTSSEENKLSYNEKTSDNGVDAFIVNDAEAAHSGATLHRTMKNRHIAMISIGGVIGTGLFLGTANSLANGGPVGLLLGYAVVGTICYSMMISLGEMIAYLPLPGGQIMLAERFVDESWAFALGWIYWFNWIIVLPAELSAASVLIHFWTTKVNDAVWVTIFLIIIITINLFGAAAYGEAEFIFASIKVITITGLIILGIVLDLGGGPNHDRLGFRYWKHPGPFVQFEHIGGSKGRFLGWFAVLTNAAFSFIGTEIVAITSGEAKNPRRNIPRAIRRVYIRILLFYIGGVTIIGLLVPSNHQDLALNSSTAAKSPFVIAIKTAGISGLPSVINAALLTSALSAASSDLYTSSRALYGLALKGNAPSFFAKVSRFGLPYFSVAFSASFGLLAYMAVSNGAGHVFGWFSNMTSVSGLMSWFGISVIYTQFYKGVKAQGLDRNSLPFRAPLQPFAAYYSAAFALFICLFSGWAVFLRGHWAIDIFITNYIPLVLFFALYIGARLWKGTRWINPEDMDFKTGLDIVEAASYEEPPPRNWVEKCWAWLVSYLVLSPSLSSSPRLLDLLCVADDEMFMAVL
ncbi:amino acid permease [Irpex rosettiformis]|uniref:Amino acid permease n=1 Tax=Irpex rosettiformis TaxID=378272 RepID=A0ACB8U1V6_9APHY|nr:amino acid permease [Irpex rosettiformis]